MTPAAWCGLAVIAGVITFIVSHEVRSATEWRSTSRRALLGQFAGVLLVVSGIYFAIQIQVG